MSPSKQNRYLKINAHKYLPSHYNFSIYIDGNIVIINDINEFLNKINEKYGHFNFYLPIHPERDCIYEEAKAVLKHRRDNAKSVRAQIKKIKQDGFPEHFGLSENNVLIRYHKDPVTIKFMDKWWKMLMKGSKRDQLSFMYISWKYNFKNYALIERKLLRKYFNIIRRHRKTF